MKIRKILLIIIMGSISANALAAFQCKSDIQAVLVYANGAVNVRHTGRDDYTHICSLKEERQGVSIATCAMWTSMLLNLKEKAKKADFYYTTTPEYNSCADLPTYSASPAPVYIGPID